MVASYKRAGMLDAYTHTHTHGYAGSIHTHIHTHTHTHKHKHIHTHTHTVMVAPVQQPIELRLQVCILVDKVLVRSQAQRPCFEDASRLRRLGFALQNSSSQGVWSQSVAKLSERLALPVGAVLDEQCLLQSIAAVQPCLLQVHGRHILLRHAEFLNEQLESAGFEWVCCCLTHTHLDTHIP